MQYFIKVKFRRLLAVIWHCRARIYYKIRKHYSTRFGRYCVLSTNHRESIYFAIKLPRTSRSCWWSVDQSMATVLDFTHAHLHKCMHFFLCASKFSNLHAHCACNFLVTNFKMNRNSKKLLISTNFQGIISVCFLYFAICVVFSLLRPSDVSTMLCK